MVPSTSTEDRRQRQRRAADREKIEAGSPAFPAGTLRMVCIGGGTGLSTLLRGLKDYMPHAVGSAAAAPDEGPFPLAQLSAIVTVTDDGGSSGRLRKDLHVPPPGDIRNCLVALSEDEALLSRLFQYRFSSGEGLEGHSFGNLFLTALASIVGDFAEAVRESSLILATRGEIFPSTIENVQLEATMDDGSIVFGETKITASSRRIVQLRMVPADAAPLPQTLKAIANADIITIGPGSLFTSLVPNLLVRGIPEAIVESRATKVFICNLMTQANESLGLSASDHIRKLYEHSRPGLFDYALVNTGVMSAELVGRYAKEKAAPIVADCESVEALGVKCVLGDFVEEGAVVRHSARRVAEELLRIASNTAAAEKQLVR